VDQEKALQVLEDLLEKLSIKIKYDRGNFKGGLVRYHKDDLLYLNRKDKTEAKIKTIVSELKEMEIPQHLKTEEIIALIKENS